ncbi:MAG: SMC family ATPase [Acidobacteriota bacterium]
MKIERLSLDGILRFHEPLTLDLTGVPAGIIAVVGSNGAGKTTILESMFAGIYGEMPSRADKPLFDLVSGRRDAFIDVEVSFDAGGRYRARTNLDGLARKRDAVLEHTGVDGRVTRLNDGKASTFDAAVTRTFPKMDTLLASAFAAQNKRGSFTTLDRKGKKDLFTELLGLNQLEAFATTARAAAQAVDRRRAELSAKVEVLAPTTTDAQADAIGEEANRLQLELGTLDLARERAVEELLGLEAQADVAIAADKAGQAALQAQAVHLARRDALARQLAAVPDERAAVDRRGRDSHAAIVRRRADAQQRYERALASLPSTADLDQELAGAVERIDSQARERRAELQERLQNNRTLLEHAEIIAGQLRDLQQLEADITHATTVHEAARLTTAELLTRGQEARAAERAEASFPADLARATADATLLERVPFGDKCAEAGCAFVQQAVEARTKIPIYEAGVARLRAAEQVVIVTTAAYLEAKAAEAEAFRRLRELKDQLAPFATTRDEHARLAVAAERVTDLEGQLCALDQDVDAQREAARQYRATRAADVAHRVVTIEAEWTQAQDTAVSEGLALKTTTDADLAALDQRSDTVRADLQQLDRVMQTSADAVASAQDAAVNRAAAETAVARARAALANVQADLARLEATVDAFERRRSEFRQRQAERQDLEADIATLDTELIEWQALARVFSRDGLPVLEIDAAGPGVSAIANDLLQSCFSGRFTVELLTQAVKADGKGMKETFDLKAWDAERGGESRDLSDMSGGEQVIVDEAIKSAIALFCNTRNVLPIRTCWRDETGGALDSENAPRYLAMLRRIRERGGFHHLYVITHNPDVAAMADVQLVVEGGTARLVYPPFSRTEAA